VGRHFENAPVSRLMPERKGGQFPDIVGQNPDHTERRDTRMEWAAHSGHDLATDSAPDHLLALLLQNVAERKHGSRGRREQEHHA
jgi:hypothetical protein